MRTPTRAAVGQSIAVLALTAIALSACQTGPRTAPEPVVTSLMVRNASAFEVNVYALPASSAKPAWLGTIGPDRTGSLPVPANVLGDARTLAVQTRALGATTAWTSEPVPVVDGRVPLLDIVANAAGNCTGSALYSITTIDLEQWMR